MDKKRRSVPLVKCIVCGESMVKNKSKVCNICFMIAKAKPMPDVKKICPRCSEEFATRYDWITMCANCYYSPRHLFMAGLYPYK